MAHDHETRRKVRAAFVQGMPLTSAAEINHVRYATARQWKAKDAESGNDWDIARNARRLSSSGVEAFANQVMDSLCEEFIFTLQAVKADTSLQPIVRTQIVSQLGDAYSKALSASRRAMPNADRLGTAMEVIKFLSTRVGDKAPDIRERFLAVCEESGDALVREFGSGL
jgi:transposase